MAAGRPFKWTSPDEMQAAVDSYFDNLGKRRLATVTGLALALDLTRQGLRNYGKRDAFAYVVARARLRVEEALENRLYDPNPAGAIFNLKNNFGWTDRRAVERAGTVLLVVQSAP